MKKVSRRTNLIGDLRVFGFAVTEVRKLQIASDSLSASKEHASIPVESVREVVEVHFVK